VYFGSVTSQLKAFIDRFECLWIAKHILRKPVRGGRTARGAFLCVAASDEERFFADAGRVVKRFFATIDVITSAELFCNGVDEQGEIASRSRAMNRAFEIGKDLCRRRGLVVRSSKKSGGRRTR